VTCVDFDEAKIDRLRQSDIANNQPGLSELVHYNSKAGRLKFTTLAIEAVPTAKCVSIAIGTPQRDDGSANLEGLLNVVDTLATLIPVEIVVIKSTVAVVSNRLHTVEPQTIQAIRGEIVWSVRTSRAARDYWPHRQGSAVVPTCVSRKSRSIHSEY
jgi:UDP-glucose 6-dehydrogenase